MLFRNVQFSYPLQTMIGISSPSLSPKLYSSARATMNANVVSSFVSITFSKHQTPS